MTDFSLNAEALPRASETEAPAVVHLCIATEQVLANALPLRLLPWDQVIVVASDHLRRRGAARLQQFLRWAEDEAHRRGLPSVQAVRLVELPDTGLGWGGLLGFARRLAAELTLAHRGRPMDVNVTGGTKLMTQAFSTAFAGQARLVYCNTQGETIEVLDAEGRTPALPLPPDLMTLQDILSAQGYEVVSAQTADDTQWLETIQQRAPLTLALVLHGHRLRQVQGYKKQRLLTLLHSAASSSLATMRPPRPFEATATLMAPHSEVWQIVLALLEKHEIARVQQWDDASANGAPTPLTLAWNSEEAVRYLSGGYLEEYAYLCVHVLCLPSAQVGMNVRLRQHGSRLPEGYDYQELDLAVVWRNRLWVLECKAGVQVHNGGGQDVLNKLDTLKAHVGGALGEGWLLTPLQLREDFEQQLPVIERARNYGIRLVHGSRDLAQLPQMLATALKYSGEVPSIGVVPADLRQALDAAAAQNRATHRA